MKGNVALENMVELGQTLSPDENNAFLKDLSDDLQNNCVFFSGLK